jgi:5'-nucleotidase
VSARPLILLSNDDGHLAPGLRRLAAVLAEQAEVVICAPETEQSSTSHSLTLTRPLRLRPVEPGVFAVDGTPADCVHVALNAGTRVVARRPDLVVSGINHGLNLGADVFYSGTVAAAREGALRCVPALAASADPGADPDAVNALCARIALGLAKAHAGAAADALGPLLNVNFPAGKGWPVVATRLGARRYDDIVEFRVDPRGREYLWIGGGGWHHAHVPGSDTEAYDRGAVSITPLLLDLTASAGAGLAAQLAMAASNGDTSGDTHG